MHKFFAAFLSVFFLASCSHTLSTAEEEFNASGQAKAIEDETDLWQFYDDPNAGFSLKYPHDVTLGENLRIESELVASLGEQPLGFTTENAEKIRSSLKNGEFGDADLDWPLEVSKQVQNLGELNAQDFLVLGRFEICSVVFERKLVFYPNDYQVVLTIEAPEGPIISENPEFFTTNPENCFEAMIWDFEKQDQFFTELSGGQGSGAAQDWFDTFGGIVETIEIQKVSSEAEADVSDRDTN